MFDLTIDRVVIYKNIEYQVVESLNSNHLLVIEKKEFETGIYPMNTCIIPEVKTD